MNVLAEHPFYAGRGEDRLTFTVLTAAQFSTLARGAAGYVHAMCKLKSEWRFLAVFGCVAACDRNPPPIAPPMPATRAVSVASAEPAQQAPLQPTAAVPAAPLQAVAAATGACSPADWSVRPLAPLLQPGKAPTASQPDRQGAAQLMFAEECTDAPSAPLAATTAKSEVVIDGVALRVASASPAGVSGRGWAGNQCAFDVRLADGSGRSIRLGSEEVPPFNTISAVVRSGSAAWLSVSFNGYTAEFPKGGNRVLALDLCGGRVVWQSENAVSNGGLLLLGDYLIAPFGFTSERRYVFVLDARSGSVVQKLPVVENVCPSKSWAPNWSPGERCDAPGQRVGAATSPRVEGGLFLVDTNTGSSAFQFR